MLLTISAIQKLKGTYVVNNKTEFLFSKFKIETLISLFKSISFFNIQTFTLILHIHFMFSRPFCTLYNFSSRIRITNAAKNFNASNIEAKYYIDITNKLTIVASEC